MSNGGLSHEIGSEKNGVGIDPAFVVLARRLAELGFLEVPNFSILPSKAFGDAACPKHQQRCGKYN